MRVNMMTWPVAVLILTTVLTLPAPPAVAAQVAVNSDFNGDGYHDLAIGTPGVPGPNGTTGAVTILYGGPGGIDAHTVRRPEAGCKSAWGAPCRSWGETVAAGDITGDNAAELVFIGGYPVLQIDSWNQDGVRTTTTKGYGGPGLQAWGLRVGQFDDQPGADIVGIDDSSGFVLDGVDYPTSHLTARFNTDEWIRNYFHDGQVRVRSIAVGDARNTGGQQMAMIVSRYMSDGQEESPYLWLLNDLKAQPTTRDDSLWAWGALCTPQNRHVLGCPKKDSQLAMGDVDGDGHLDVVMATPSLRGLQVWYGSASGFSQFPGFSAHDIGWFDADSGVGSDLAVGDVNGDGAAEIVLGAPDAAASGQTGAGGVAIIPGSTASPRGPVLTAAQIITQDGIASPNTPTPTPTATPTVSAPPSPTPTAVPTLTGDPEPQTTFDPKPTAEPQSLTAARAAAVSADPISEQSVAGDRFGQSVRVLDVTRDGKAEVIVGAPGKNGGAGMLVVLRGSSSGVSESGTQVFHPGQFGIGSPQTAFGKILHR
ncbi:FG-GAP-like repeat-containing protein [Nonomuraea dietziae]|uniref:FG-GAP-like repeat-containing protein n=1 Tax=Nonomuraea dietziae TaxID=65515 RepID=UPI0033D7AF4E